MMHRRLSQRTRITTHAGHVRQAGADLPGRPRHPCHARNPPGRLTAAGLEPTAIVSVDHMHVCTTRALVGRPRPQLSPRASTMVISPPALGPLPERLFLSRTLIASTSHWLGRDRSIAAGSWSAQRITPPCVSRQHGTASITTRWPLTMPGQPASDRRQQRMIASNAPDDAKEMRNER